VTLLFLCVKVTQSHKNGLVFKAVWVSYIDNCLLAQVHWSEQQLVKRRIKRSVNDFNDPKWPRMWYLVGDKYFPFLLHKLRFEFCDNDLL
jgi:hypothetical protein